MAMYARISTIEGGGGKIDDAVKIINEKIMPVLEAMKGKVVGFESYEVAAQSW